jgi:excisionase family DNA binding protein
MKKEGSYGVIAGDEARTQYEIRVRAVASGSIADSLVVDEDELLPWVLHVVGPEAMRDFVLGRLAGGRLTTQQAADRLGMSRPSLIKLLERGEMRYTMVGNRRYVEQQSVEEYQRRANGPHAEQFARHSDQVIDENLRALQRMAEDEGDFAE